MSDGSFRQPERPVVVAICATPLLLSALEAELDGIATVQSLPAKRADPRGLVRNLEPDAVVVDTDADADALEELGIPLVHVNLREGTIRTLGPGGWVESDDDSALRNVVVRELFSRKNRHESRRRDDT